MDKVHFIGLCLRLKGVYELRRNVMTKKNSGYLEVEKLHMSLDRELEARLEREVMKYQKKADDHNKGLADGSIPHEYRDLTGMTPQMEAVS